MNGKRFHDHAHRENPWVEAVKGAIIVALIVLVAIAMSVCETCG